MPDRLTASEPRQTGIAITRILFSKMLLSCGLGACINCCWLTPSPFLRHLSIRYTKPAAVDRLTPSTAAPLASWAMTACACSGEG